MRLPDVVHSAWRIYEIEIKKYESNHILELLLKLEGHFFGKDWEFLGKESFWLLWIFKESSK